MPVLCSILKYFSAIMNWSSNAFYENELVAHSSVASRLLKDLPGIKSDENTGLTLLNVV